MNISLYLCKVVYLLIPTSNHNSRSSPKADWFVVYLLIPTSNHNSAVFWRQCLSSCISFDSYIKPQLRSRNANTSPSCISFDSYIKPQLMTVHLQKKPSCISFDSYIKPQPQSVCNVVVLCCISFDSYIKPQPSCLRDKDEYVVYLLIPTSNHNPRQTSTANWSVVYLLIPTSNHNQNCRTLFCCRLYIF